MHVSTRNTSLSAYLTASPAKHVACFIRRVIENPGREGNRHKQHLHAMTCRLLSVVSTNDSIAGSQNCFLGTLKHNAFAVSDTVTLIKPKLGTYIDQHEKRGRCSTRSCKSVLKNAT